MSDPLQLTRILCAFAVLLQTFELIALRKTFDNHGIWRWSILKRDLGKSPFPFRLLFSASLPYKNFLVLLTIRILAAIATLFISNAYLFSILLFSNLLISIRWRGAFNGGSDYMTTLILLSLAVSSFFPENPDVYLGCVYYIVLQACLSYFISGVVKLRSPNWRSGAALHAFLSSSIFEVPSLILKALQTRSIALFFSWLIIIFECAFPLALLDRQFCLIVLGAGALFHLVNVYLFGLNRFFFIWIATYPVIYWCSK